MFSSRTSLPNLLTGLCMLTIAQAAHAQDVSSLREAGSGTHQLTGFGAVVSVDDRSARDGVRLIRVEGELDSTTGKATLVRGDHVKEVSNFADGAGLEQDVERANYTILPIDEQFAHTGRFALTFSEDGQNRRSQGVLGTASPDAILSASGRAFYEGAFTLTRTTEGAPVILQGPVQVDVNFSEGLVSVVLTEAFRLTDDGLVPDQQLFEQLCLCDGVLQESAVFGGQIIPIRNGDLVTLIGPGESMPENAPNPAAYIASQFFGWDAATAHPREIGGVAMLVGDQIMMMDYQAILR